jgi:hypothetical protein
MAVTEAVKDHTTKWLSFLRADLEESIPIRINTGSVFAADGTPEWAPEFTSWMKGNSRVVRAMRRLRRVSVREYEVAYRALFLGQTDVQIAKWLTERAIRNDKPERYSKADAQVIVVSAIDKLLAWW